jgi:hypothetical protein
MQIFTNNIDADVYDQIKILAIKRKKKISEIISEALVDILRKYENE